MKEVWGTGYGEGGNEMVGYRYKSSKVSRCGFASRRAPEPLHRCVIPWRSLSVWPMQYGLGILV